MTELTIEIANDVLRKYIDPLGYDSRYHFQHIDQAKSLKYLDRNFKHLQSEEWRSGFFSLGKKTAYISVVDNKIVFSVFGGNELSFFSIIGLDYWTREGFETSLVAIIERHPLFHHDYLICKDIIE